MPAKAVRRAGAAEGGPANQPTFAASALRSRMAMSRPPRIRGFSYVGPYRYFLTLCCSGRHAAFRNAETVDVVSLHFRRSAREFSFALLAYCFMPDHVHLPAEGADAGANLTVFVKRAKQRSGRAYAARSNRRLWQEGYFDRVLRPDDDARAIAGYIIANPVRAGLVARPEEYPYSGSEMWTIGELCHGLMW